MKSTLRIGILATAFFGSVSAWAFPEMIRHGYVHCASCHYNPAGGGTLTPYGRSISAEVLSTWSYTGEERVFHGALSKNASSYLQGEKNPSFILGGDVRWVQLHQENTAVRRRKFFLMQADLEAGVTYKQISVLSTFGQEKFGETDRWRFRKTYLKAQANDNFSVKLGRAQPNLGLMWSEHFLSSRSDAGLGPIEMKDLIEVQGNFESFGVLVGAERSPAEIHDRPSAESGAYVQGEYIIDNYKFGLHYWHRNSDIYTRHRFGGHSLMGLTKRLGIFTDWQFLQEYIPGSERKWGVFASGKVTYEPFKGLWLSLWADYQQRDLKVNRTGRERIGPGLQFFPRPHLELQALWLKDHPHTQGAWGDYAMLVMHYYL